MNSIPRPPTLIHPISYSPDVQQFIREKLQNFVGRQFVFKAIKTFLIRNSRGYFTIVGYPGSGKSAILAEYIHQNPNAIFYSCELPGKTQAEQFLEILCTQLINSYPLGYSSLPENATTGSWFLTLLLQEISDILSNPEKLVIVIDALDKIDFKTQTPGSNLFYLPRYLPDNIYFLLSRRPFLKETSGLLVETPNNTLNLSQYSQQNQQDITTYLNFCFSEPKIKQKLESKLTSNNLTKNEFCQLILTQSQNNFKYVSEIIAANSSLQFQSIPPELTAYYQTHWQQMTNGKPSELQVNIMGCLTQSNQLLSCDFIAEELDEDEYDIQLILDNWIEFLEQQNIKGEICYNFYHSIFSQFLHQIKST